MSEPLNAAELEALRALNTPTVANAIERFNVRARHVGFTGPEIRCMFPEMPPIVGYATTALITAEQPAVPGRTPAVGDYWEFIQSIPAPRIAVSNGYVAPEILAGEASSVASDIHALGVMMYQLLVANWPRPPLPLHASFIGLPTMPAQPPSSLADAAWAELAPTDLAAAKQRLAAMMNAEGPAATQLAAR